MKKGTCPNCHTPHQPLIKTTETLIVHTKHHQRQEAQKTTYLCNSCYNQKADTYTQP